MSTRVEVEDIGTTKSEKLLAWVLAFFLLIAGIWTYQKLDDTARGWVDRPTVSAQDRAAIKRAGAASERFFRAKEDEDRALSSLELRREEYRTQLDAGRDVPTLAAAYRDAQREYRSAQSRTAAAKREQDASAAAAR